MSPYCARWYVYELVDPRSDTVFYVGKGQRNRVDQHEEEARKGVTSHKCNKIRSIWDDGHQIGKRKIALFWDEAAAYECEAARINEIGLHNLTNVMSGSIPMVDWIERRHRAEDAKQNKVKPVTVEDCMKIIRDYTGWVSAWLRRPESANKVTVTATGTGALWAINKIAIEGLINFVIPMAWEKAANDPSTHEELVRLLRPWNISLILEPSSGMSEKRN